MKDQNVPVVSLKSAFQVTGHIVVNLDGAECIQDTHLVMHRKENSRAN